MDKGYTYFKQFLDDFERENTVTQSASVEAQQLGTEIVGQCPLFYWEREVYWYNGTHHRRLSHEDLCQLAETYAGSRYQHRLDAHEMEQAVQGIRDAAYERHREITESILDCSVMNGLLDTGRMVLEPHTSYYLTDHQIQVRWEEGKECPKFQAFLDQVTDGDRELRDMYLTILSYEVMSSGNMAKCILCFYGEYREELEMLSGLLKRFYSPEDVLETDLSAMTTEESDQVTAPLVISRYCSEEPVSQNLAAVLRHLSGNTFESLLDGYLNFTGPFSKTVLLADGLLTTQKPDRILNQRMFYLPVRGRSAYKTVSEFLSDMEPELPGILNLLTMSYRRVCFDECKFMYYEGQFGRLDRNKAPGFEESALTLVKEMCVPETDEFLSDMDLYRPLYIIYRDGWSEETASPAEGLEMAKEMLIEEYGAEPVLRIQGKNKEEGLLGVRLKTPKEVREALL